MLPMLAARLLVFGIGVTCLCGEAKQRERRRLKGGLGTGIFGVAGPERYLLIGSCSRIVSSLQST